MGTKEFTQSEDNLHFSSPDVSFVCRAIAVIRSHGHVLLHRAVTDDFWALPGGRPHHFESAPRAVRREMLEELGETVEVGDLCAVVEIVYANVHEMDFCFDVILPPGSRLHDLNSEHRGDEGDVELVYRWFPEDELRSIYLLPRTMAAMLTSRLDGCAYWFDDERAGAPLNGGGHGDVTEHHRYATAEESRRAGIAYHLTPADVWARQKESGSYLPEAYAQDGFIHTTNGLDPLLEVANLFYQGDGRDYRVLVLSVPELTSEVRYDDENHIYPHIYGPLNTSAVIGELDVQRAGDGAFLGFA